jgi:hypothetical protein
MKRVGKVCILITLLLLLSFNLARANTCLTVLLNKTRILTSLNRLKMLFNFRHVEFFDSDPGDSLSHLVGSELLVVEARETYEDSLYDGLLSHRSFEISGQAYSEFEAETALKEGRVGEQMILLYVSSHEATFLTSKNELKTIKIRQTRKRGYGFAAIETGRDILTLAQNTTPVLRMEFNSHTADSTSLVGEVITFSRGSYYNDAAEHSYGKPYHVSTERNEVNRAIEFDNETEFFKALERMRDIKIRESGPRIGETGIVIEQGLDWIRVYLPDEGKIEMVHTGPGTRHRTYSIYLVTNGRSIFTKPSNKHP